MNADEERLIKKLYNEVASLSNEVQSLKQDLQNLSNERLAAEVISLREETTSLKQDIKVLTGLVRILARDKMDIAISESKETDGLDTYISLTEDEKKSMGSNASRALSALHFAGVYTYRDFKYITRKHISTIRNVGKGTLKVIEYMASSHGIDLSKDPEPVNFQAGDPVILRVTPNGWQGNRMKAKKGDVLTIRRIIPPKDQHYYYCMPQYVCKDHEDNDIYLSPGQIKAI